MSPGDYQRVVERMATDSEFAQWVHADPSAALAAYDLGAEERQRLVGLQAEGSVATATRPAVLATRRSRSSIFGLGAIGAVAVAGAATLGYLQTHPGAYVENIAVNGKVDPVKSIAIGDAPAEDFVQNPPTAGTLFDHQVTIRKAFGATEADLATTQQGGRNIATITLTVKRGSSDWLRYTLTNALVTSTSAPTIGTANATPGDDTIVIRADTITASYPGGR